MISTFLMFSGKNYGKAEEALNFYISIFKNSEINLIEYFEKTTLEGKKTISKCLFKLENQKFMIFDSEYDHQFNFTPSMSLFIDFEEEIQIEEVYKNLLKNGIELMPLDKYEFSKKFGWIQDQYGISWQLNLK